MKRFVCACIFPLLSLGACTAALVIIRMDDASMLRSLLHQLPQPQQEVFMWRVFAELSFREIGRLFGKTENWACVTYHRARMQIRRKMEERQHEE